MVIYSYGYLIFYFSFFMSSFINFFDNTLTNVGENFENMFRSCKKMGLPQYKYFTVPIYKSCVGRIGEVAATGISFFAADLILHQAALQVLNCMSSYLLSPITPDSLEEHLGFKEACHPSYSYLKTLCWAAFAIPVMYAKYKRQ